MNLRDWYYPVQIPKTFNGDTVDKFVTAIAGMWQHMLDDIAKPTVSLVKTATCPTAMADLKFNKMFINRDIWSNVHEERPNKTASTEEAIGTIIGLQIHEILHFKFSLMNLDERIESIGLPFNKTLASIINIVEDTYIDDKAPSIARGYDWAYHYLVGYFFPQSYVDSVLKNLPTEIKSKEDGDSFLQFSPLVRQKMLKYDGRFVNINWSKLKKSPTIDKFISMVMSSTSLHLIEDRTNLSVQIFEFLYPNEKISSSDEDANSEDANGNDESDKDSSNKSSSDNKEKSGGLLKNHESKLAESFSSDVFVGKIDPGTDEKIVTSNETLSKRDDKSSGEKYSELVFKPTKEFFELYGFYSPSRIFEYLNKSGKSLFSENEKYQNLSKLMKARSETHRFAGQQKNFGTRMRHIERIVTDGKIFSEQIVSQGLGFQEIVILVDLSSSMSVSVIKALGAAYAAACALCYGGHSVAVVGHTADISLSMLDERVELFMPVFKTMSESVASMKVNIQTFIEYSPLCNNNDDLALSRAKMFFTSKRNKKTLIVISDGEPSSFRLNDSEKSISFTRKVVIDLRSSGINVISISIDKSSFAGNNKIYGADKNTCNEDLSILVDLVKMIAT